jgi:deoxyribodipyrimidine photo-lyase
MHNTAILWFRNDLRLHDNEALVEAIDKATFVVPVYVFDPRVFKGKTRFGFDKISKFRTKFILEAVANLRYNLQQIGADLIIRIGHPEEEVYQLAKECKSSWVYCNRERTQEELDIQDALENNLWTIGQELRYARGKMLYHTADLPFPISQVPDTFTAFRKEVEDFVTIRSPYPTPTQIQLPDLPLDRGVMPTLDTFDKEHVEVVHIENKNFIGGETEGLRHFDNYLWQNKLALTYKDDRDGLLGWDFSTKLSAWLAHGCISPKYVIEQIQKFETEVTKNKSTYWIHFELMWRDYFRLMGKKYGNLIFQLSGIKQDKQSISRVDLSLFDLWAKGNTGIPFIDANMRQLNTTGYMSNRGRQNVASFLVKDLHLDWRLGAEYFESMLIDYDPCSNYCNWNYITGIGNDPREDRYFNVMTQALKYDGDGTFVRYWLPFLREVPIEMVHILDTVTRDRYNYPRPVVNLQYD